MSRTCHISLLLLFVVVAGSCFAQQQVMDRDLQKMAEKIFADAKAYLKQEAYYDATREFIILLDYYQDFQRMDEVVLLLGDCLYEMDLYNAATEMYTYLIKNYFSSPLLSKALLGLEKAKFKEGNYQESLNFYEAILQAPRPVDVDDEARYYAGQSYYHIKDYPNTLEAMLNLDPRSEYYDYGLYTVGLSLLRMKSIKRAVAVFRKLVTMPIISEERRAVVDEGRLTLGFLYYELGYYREAINYFIKISESHRRYPDALLAQGWSFIKYRNFTEAIAPLVELVDKFPDDYKAEEALLLLGRCYLELDLYNEAIAVYEKIILLFPEENVLPDLVNTVNQSLDLEDESIERLREDLLVLESKLIESLPYDDSSALPDYLQEEKEELNNSRETLLETIKRERVNFLQMQANIQELKELLAIKLERKSWRAYAEYGKSRALFLKGTTQKGDK